MADKALSEILKKQITAYGDDSEADTGSPASETTASQVPGDKPPPPAPTTPKFTHSPRLVSLARDFGIPQEAIEDASSEQLIAWVDTMRQQERRYQEEAARERAQAQDQRRAVAERQVQQPAEDDGLEGLTEEELDPRLFRFMKKMAAFQKENAELRRQVAELHGHTQAQVQRQQLESADSILASFEEFHPWIGQGSHTNHDPESLEIAARAKIMQRAAKIAQNGFSGDLKQLLHKAGQEVLGSRLTKEPAGQKEPELTPDQIEWLENGSTLAPTNRGKVKAPRGKAEAIRQAKEITQDRGVEFPEDDESDDDPQSKY